MAAYAALVSLMHIIEKIQHHPCPPISLDEELVESLTEKITFLQDFLEGYSFGGSKEVESRIADAAYAAEDIIESQIVDQILGRSLHGKIIGCFEVFLGLCSIKFCQGLEKVIRDMDLMKKEVMEIKEKMGVQHQLRGSSMTASSSRSRPTGQNVMVSFDDVLDEILDKLTGAQPDRQIIPIVGMGGIGKTTLARNIYVNPLIREYFDIRAWVTISQEYSMRGVLRVVLGQVKKEGRGDLHAMNENELGEMLHKHLCGRRYFIVMDDMWSIEVWDEIKFFFPDYNNWSRIVITTRLSNLASELTGSNYRLEMKLLDEVKSWNLFCKTVFKEEGCPFELEEIGQKIAKNCKGLPLSIVMIGGLLARSEHTREYWEYIAENINSVLNLEDDERCFKILYMSYNHLPVHLKPCFLYMGVFPEDHEIRVSNLMKLWVAEGFLKPVSGKSLEEVAKVYFKDLIDRNLILVHKLGSIGSIKECKIHDLLRDLCLREAQKDRFYDVIRQPSLNVPKGIYTQRRIVIPESISEEKILNTLQAKSLVRSLIWDVKVLPLFNFKLLRICQAYYKVFPPHEDNTPDLRNVFRLVNLQYIAIEADCFSEFTSSVHLLWNLHTLFVEIDEGIITAPVEIWNMPQLRHVEFTSLKLPDPPSHNVDGQDGVALRNLQTLGTIINLDCSEEVVKRIPNIKKLKTKYNTFQGNWSPHYAINFDSLHKLESLCCFFDVRASDHFMQNLNFPHSLKKLTLKGNDIYWEDLMEKIGSLPLLEKLKLDYGSFKSPLWETVEGQFCSLKFLKISMCFGLENWLTESTHFPRLEHLVLSHVPNLEEIPLDIGEIPTLQSIKVKFCSNSVVISAKRIVEEQEELGEVGLQVRVRVWEKNEALESLASRNFHIE